jgi:FAD/FMN-containing dehydrogenase
MSDFATFKKEFKGDLILPTDSDYPTAVARWAVNAERKAKIIAFVKDNKDVVLAISHAQANNLPVAIRGGGYNPSGASSSQDGLVIDLSKYINTVRVDPEQKVAYVGGGAIWATVDKEAIKYGLATVGAHVNVVSCTNMDPVESVKLVTN